MKRTNTAPLVVARCPLADAIARAHRGELEHHVVEQSVVDKTRLMAELRNRRAESMVVVEGIRSLAGNIVVPTIEDHRSLIAAASVAGVRRLILVTSRPEDDPELRRLRQSGVPYVVLRVEALLQTNAEVELAAHAARRVIVPETMLTQTDGAVRTARVVEAITRALHGDVAPGCTFDVAELCPDQEPPLVAAIAAAGAEPIRAGTWRARLARWLARPRVALTEDGQLSVVTRAPSPATQPRDTHPAHESAA